MDRKAVTSKEIENETGASPQLVKHVMDKMAWFGLLKTSKTVQAGYVNQPGRPPAIFQTPEASPEDARGAEKRYAVIALGFDPEKRRRENEAKAKERERLKEETWSRELKEKNRRLVEQYEPLIKEIMVNHGDHFKQGKQPTEIYHVYRDDHGTIKETENPSPKNGMDFLWLISEARRRVQGTTP